MPTTANTALRDAFIRHQISLLRYSDTVKNRIVALLDKTEPDIAKKIREKLKGTTGLNSPAEVRRLNALLETVRAIRNGAWEEANSYVTGEMTDLSYQEPISLQAILGFSSPVLIETVIPPIRQLKGIALSKPFEGRLLKEWASTMQSDDLRRIEAAIRIGMVSGESADTIARRVLGTGVFDGRDGVTETTRRQVSAIVRTAVQHVANNVRNDFFLDNADILEGEIYVATLDSRTTAVCRGLDGKRFPVGKGPRPPLHIGCRSLRVGYFGTGLIGSRPANPTTDSMLLDEYTTQENIDPVASRDELPKGFKADYDKFQRKRLRELVGPIPADTTYNDWLKTQSHSFQNEILGIDKAKLFRAGATLDKYVSASGTELTLAQMAKKYKDLFIAAGLNPGAY